MDSIITALNYNYIIINSLSVIKHLMCGCFIKLSDHCLSGSGSSSWLHFLLILGLLDTCMVVSFSQVEENNKNTLIIVYNFSFTVLGGFQKPLFGKATPEELSMQPLSDPYYSFVAIYYINIVGCDCLYSLKPCSWTNFPSHLKTLPSGSPPSENTRST